MKLPDEVQTTLNRVAGYEVCGDLALMESIVRHCAKVCEKRVQDTYPETSTDADMEAAMCCVAILREFGLEP